MTETFSTYSNIGITNGINHSRWEKLRKSLKEDMDFHGQHSFNNNHNLHPFPAKFPPQLPNLFIRTFTSPDEVVLDPMSGSGTTLLEAISLGRKAVGIDIDLLSLLITEVKVNSGDARKVVELGNIILERAIDSLNQDRTGVEKKLKSYFDVKTKQFIDNWFLEETQLCLTALLERIRMIKEPRFRSYFELVFSSIIITKSGGVSLALDLAHTRPHKAKIVRDESGNLIYDVSDNSSRHERYITKIIRSPFSEFKKRTRQIAYQTKITGSPAGVLRANAMNMPLESDSIDLIVTSPPYASNAIDYMRAHKFSLVWLGYSLDELSVNRNKYIGSESTSDFQFQILPDKSSSIISNLAEIDPKKSRVLHRYYSEMKNILREMFRVLKPGKSAIIVVGDSIMRGIRTKTPECLAEIGEQFGFNVPLIGERTLDRNRRMLPASPKMDKTSQIQQRMEREYVIGFYKPV